MRPHLPSSLQPMNSLARTISSNTCGKTESIERLSMTSLKCLAITTLTTRLTWFVMLTIWPRPSSMHDPCRQLFAAITAWETAASQQAAPFNVAVTRESQSLNSRRTSLGLSSAASDRTLVPKAWPNEPTTCTSLTGLVEGRAVPTTIHFTTLKECNRSIYKGCMPVQLNWWLWKSSQRDLTRQIQLRGPLKPTRGRLITSGALSTEKPLLESRVNRSDVEQQLTPKVSSQSKASRKEARLRRMTNRQAWSRKICSALVLWELEAGSQLQTWTWWRASLMAQRHLMNRAAYLSSSASTSSQSWRTDQSKQPRSRKSNLTPYMWRLVKR